MSFQAYFFKPHLGPEIKLNVVPSAIHSVHHFGFKDFASLREKLRSEADMASPDIDAIFRELTRGRLWRVPRNLETAILNLIRRERFDTSRPIPRDVESFVMDSPLRF